MKINLYACNKVKKILTILLTIFVLASCKPIHQVVVDHVVETHVKDSLVIRDSIVTIPQEVYTNLTWKYDTLHLETSLASATAWVDSLWLRGTMKNKNVASFHHETETIYKDSIRYEKVPVPYPVEVEVKNPVNWKLLLWAILSSGGLLFMFWMTFRSSIIKLFTRL